LFKFPGDSFNIWSHDAVMESHIRCSVEWNSSSCYCWTPVPRMRNRANGKFSWIVRFGTPKKSWVKCQKTYGYKFAAYYGLGTKTILQFQLEKIRETINCCHSCASCYCFIEFGLRFLRLLQLVSGYVATLFYDFPPLSAVECCEVLFVCFSLRYSTNSSHYFLKIHSFNHWTNIYIYFLVLTI
jgi:hypothetical protein